MLSSRDQGELRSDLSSAWLQSRRLVWTLILAMPVIYLLSGVYTVEPQQRGIQYRFGKLVNENVAPGMHYHLPYPIEKVEILPASSIQSIEVEFKSLGVELQPKGLLTGDQNLIELAINVQFSQADLGDYLHNSVDAEQLLTDIIRSNTSLYLMSETIDSLLTTGRNSLQNQVKSKAQKALNDLESGIQLSSVQIKRMEPPSSVKSEFERVDRARSKKRKLVQDARSQQKRLLSKARTKAREMTLQAKSLADEKVKNAAGDGERLRLLIDEIQKSPDTAVNKLYSQMLNTILSGVKLQLIKPSAE